MDPQKHDHPNHDHDDEKKESKVHTEEVKSRHTSHWDLDYLPTEQVDDAYDDQDDSEDNDDQQSEEDSA